MPVQKEQAAKLLEILEHIRKRPNMYMTEDFPPIVNFMNGFNVAYRIFEATPGFEDYDDGIDAAILQERGWEESAARHPVQEMRERGMNDATITEELLTIAIEVVKRRYFSEDMD